MSFPTNRRLVEVLDHVAVIVVHWWQVKHSWLNFIGCANSAIFILMLCFGFYVTWCKNIVLAHLSNFISQNEPRDSVDTFLRTIIKWANSCQHDLKIQSVFSLPPPSTSSFPHSILLFSSWSSAAGQTSVSQVCWFIFYWGRKFFLQSLLLKAAAGENLIYFQYKLCD